MPSVQLQQWSAEGSSLVVPGTASTRIWRQGTGPAVVCLHGVPASAYLYRKMLPELASLGLQGIALDFPGLGFADRPSDFDYSWRGLSNWLDRALTAAGLDSFHLVVHDIGGPIGFDLIRKNPTRILSLTVLNTLVRVSTFTKPFIMRPFSWPGLGRLFVLQMNTPMSVGVMRWRGVCAGPGYSELRVYGELLVHGDGGQAFQQIMRSFNTTAQFEEEILGSLGDRKFPAQVVWGRYDADLRASTFGEDARRALNLVPAVHMVDGKHFLQENCPSEIAQRIAKLVSVGVDI